MSEINRYGIRMEEQSLPVQQEAYASFAGASVSAFRYAVEWILYLKGEGESMADMTADSPFTGWETIAEINYTSPYPSYFEGLIYEVQGKTEECLEPYAMASVMPMFPEEGLDFYYLKKMDVDALYELRGALRALEDTIYASYFPELTGRQWDRALFDAGYAFSLSVESAQAGDRSEALWYARQALKSDPSVAEHWENAAACAFFLDDLEQAGAFVDEGLAVFPENENLLAFRQKMLDTLKEMGVAQ
jgi:tetratricopeptide (TPR) repeat protein